MSDTCQPEVNFNKALKLQKLLKTFLCSPRARTPGHSGGGALEGSRAWYIPHQTPHIRHTSSDIWHTTQTSDIRRLTYHIRHLTWDVWWFNGRRLMSYVSCPMSDVVCETSDVRCLMSDVWCLMCMSNVWHTKSDIWHQTSDIPHRTSDI